MKHILIFIIIAGIISNFAPGAILAEENASKMPSESPKTLETPYIPPFIYDFFKTSAEEALNGKEWKDLPGIIKNIYNGIYEWYNNIPQEQKDKFYKKVELILGAVIKAIFDLLEQIIKIIFS